MTLRVSIEINGKPTHTITARRTTKEQAEWNKYEWHFQSHEGRKARIGGFVEHKFDKGALHLVRIIILKILSYYKER